MTGRASIVGAAVTHVGKVREHNEDAHLFDGDNGLFLVCDGMGGHAAGEVASAIAIRTIRQRWADNATHGAIDAFLADGSPESRRHLLTTLREGVMAAHDAIIAEAQRDEAKTGMGTTLVGAIVVGGDVVFAHAGDSRAYLVRDNIAMQLTEDHTLLSRLLAAGIDVDLTGEGSRFKSMLTNALGIGQECKVSTFIVPLADGDRFMLCSDGISEYVQEAEIGDVLSKAPSPSRAAQKLVDLALERGGGDNATALVVRILEAGESPLPVERRKRDDDVIAACPIWGLRVNPQQRLRALRITTPREYAAGEKVPAQTLGDRVAWILVEGEVEQDGKILGPTSLLYPEALISTATLPDKDGLAIATLDVRALAIRADDFRELCEDDAELGEAMTDALVKLVQRRPVRETARLSIQQGGRAKTDPGEETTAILSPPQPPPPPAEPLLPPVAGYDTGEEPATARAPTRPDSQFGRAKTNPPTRRMSEDEMRGATAQHAVVQPPPDTIPPPIAAAKAVAKGKNDGGDSLRALWGTKEPEDVDEPTRERSGGATSNEPPPELENDPAVIDTSPVEKTGDDDDAPTKVASSPAEGASGIALARSVTPPGKDSPATASSSGPKTLIGIPAAPDLSRLPPMDAPKAGTSPAPQPSIPRTMTPRPEPGQPVVLGSRTVTPLKGVESIAASSDEEPTRDTTNEETKPERFPTPIALRPSQLAAAAAKRSRKDDVDPLATTGVMEVVAPPADEAPAEETASTTEPTKPERLPSKTGKPAGIVPVRVESEIEISIIHEDDEEEPPPATTEAKTVEIPKAAAKAVADQTIPMKPVADATIPMKPVPSNALPLPSETKPAPKTDAKPSKPDALPLPAEPKPKTAGVNPMKAADQTIPMKPVADQTIPMKPVASPKNPDETMPGLPPTIPPAKRAPTADPTSTTTGPMVIPPKRAPTADPSPMNPAQRAMAEAKARATAAKPSGDIPKIPPPIPTSIPKLPKLPKPAEAAKPVAPTTTPEPKKEPADATRAKRASEGWDDNDN